jgi:methylmalonyl-CoA mutase
VDELTDLVEEAVYQEFERISERGSMTLVGVNTFLPAKDHNRGHGEVGEIELMRSSDDEKIQQVANVEAFRDLHAEESAPLLKQLQQVARERKNTFDALVKAARVSALCAGDRGVGR